MAYDVATLALQVDSQGFVTGVQQAERALESFATATQSTEKKFSGLGSAMADFKQKLLFLAGAAGFTFATAKIVQMAREAVLLAARYETLGVVVQRVAGNVGATAADMSRLEKSLRATGITAVQARQQIIAMIQANIDLTQATKLARIAQDAAVVGNMNSSEAFGRLIHGIRTGQTDVLRTLGLQIDMNKAMTDYADKLGKSVSALSQREKQQARVNAVMEQGKQIEGAYESAMGTAGKQLQSMKRYTEDLLLALGKFAQPIFTTAVFAMAEVLKVMEKNAGLVMTALIGLAARGLQPFIQKLILVGATALKNMASYGAEAQALGAATTVKLGSAQADVLRTKAAESLAIQNLAVARSELARQQATQARMSAELGSMVSTMGMGPMSGMAAQSLAEQSQKTVEAARMVGDAEVAVASAVQLADRAMRNATIGATMLNKAMLFLKTNWITAVVMALGYAWVKHTEAVNKAKQAYETFPGAVERFTKWMKEWKPIIEKWKIKITVEGEEELEKLREILKKDITKKMGWALDVSVWGRGKGVIRETSMAVVEMWKQVQAGNLAWETFELNLRAIAENSGPEIAEWISGMLPLLGKLKAVMPGLGEGKGGPSPEEVEKTKQQEAAARQLRALQAQMAITEAQTKRLSLATRENTFAVEMAQQAIAVEKQAMSDAEPFWEAWQKQLGESEEKEISLAEALSSTDKKLRDQAQRYVAAARSRALNSQAIDYEINRLEELEKKYEENVEAGKKAVQSSQDIIKAREQDNRAARLSIEEYAAYREALERTAFLIERTAGLTGEAYLNELQAASAEWDLTRAASAFNAELEAQNRILQANSERSREAAINLALVRKQLAGKSTRDPLSPPTLTVQPSAPVFIENPATHIVEAYGPAGQPDLDVLTVGSEANSKLNKLGKLVLESMKEAARSVVQVFTQMFDQILLTGQLSFEKLAQSIASVFTSVIAGALGAMLQAKIEEFWKKLEAGDLFPKGKGPKKGGIDTTGWKTLPGVMGAVAGASVGYTSANPLMGAIGGAMAGSAAGPLGMVVGGVAGIVGGILGIGKAAEEEARRLREAKDKWLDALKEFALSIEGGPLEKALFTLRKNLNAMIDEWAKATDNPNLRGKDLTDEIIRANAAGSGKPSILPKELRELLALYIKAVDQAAKDFANMLATRANDLKARELEASGDKQGAERLRFAMTQWKERIDLEKELGSAFDASMKAQLEYVQGLEREQFFKRQAREREEAAGGLTREMKLYGARKNPVEAATLQAQFDYADSLQAAQDLYDSGMISKELFEQYAAFLSGKLADSIQEAIDAEAELQQRRGEDLEVRKLRALGRSKEADDMAFQLSQQREMADAIKAGWSEAELAILAGLQTIESEARAAAEAFNIQQTGISADARIAQLSGDEKGYQLYTKEFEVNEEIDKWTTALNEGRITQEKYDTIVRAINADWERFKTGLNTVASAIGEGAQGGTLDTQVTAVERQAFATVEAAGYLASMNVYLREISENTSYLRPSGVDNTAAINVGAFNYGQGGSTGATVVINVSSAMMENPSELGQMIINGIDTALSKRANMSNGAVGTVRVM